MFNELLTGKIWKFGDNISTDLMIPAFLMDKEKTITPREQAKFCMFANRPDWAAQVSQGDIIIAGKNFGCGSSRPAASRLQILGISLVVAESMSRIFFRNSINLGFPVFMCKGVHEIFSEGEIAEVDLTKGTVKNLSTGKTLTGEVLPDDSPPMQILRAGGIIPLLQKEYLE